MGIVLINNGFSNLNYDMSLNSTSFTRTCETNGLILEFLYLGIYFVSAVLDRV